MPNARKRPRPMRSAPKTAPSGAQPSLTKANYQALADFRYAMRRFLAFSESAAKAAGLSVQQHQALLSIKGAPGGEAMNIRQLSTRLLINHNTAVELVDRLVEGALVKRSRDPVDRRRAQIVLTAKAERLLLALSTAHLKELQTVRPAMQTLLKQLE